VHALADARLESAVTRVGNHKTIRKHLATDAVPSRVRAAICLEPFRDHTACRSALQ